jgi:alkylation response protein AidB-like acyl-CoA dehydrogenase
MSTGAARGTGIRPSDFAPAPDDFIARAKALAPLIAAAAPQIEAQRTLTPEIVAALHDAGLFRMLLPRSIGGAELPPPLFVQAVEQLAKADASVAWVIAQTSICSTLAASLQPKVAREIFGKQEVLSWGPFSPKGRAVADPAGFRITGAWNFASGSRHADWMGAHCPIYESDGRPRLNADGTHADLTAIFPKSSATFTDNWEVMGLKGTGSDSYSVTDLLVPAERTTSAHGKDLAARFERGPLYQFTIFQLFPATFAGIALGIARAVLDAFVDLAKTKKPTHAPGILRDNAVIQSQVGVSETQLASARVYLLHVLEEMYDQISRSGAVTMDLRIGLRMAASNASLLCRELVERCYHAAGATAIFESNPFERRFRDLHAVSQQVQSHFSQFEAIGQHFLGLPPQTKFI